MSLDRAGISRLIPHSGPMILIDRVISFDAKSILCVTESHHRPDNPLYRDGALPAVCGAEYGAQAAAIHGPALTGTRMRPGRIVFLRNMEWELPVLNEVDGPLEVRARCLLQDTKSLAYEFKLFARGHEVVHGECGIVLL